MRFVFVHFKAIHGYRETEKSSWNKANTVVLERIQRKAFRPGASLLGHVHVLDLAGEGKIKPHVDSVRVNRVKDSWSNQSSKKCHNFESKGKGNRESEYMQ